MKFSITNVTRYGKAYYKDVAEISEDDIDTLLNTEHSFCVHNNNRRLNDEITEINGIILDFDGKGDHLESSIVDVMYTPIWEDNYCFIITSKSQGVAPRDCFHLYIPFNRPISKKEFSSKKTSIKKYISDFGLSFDEKFNMLGFVNPSPKGKVYYSQCISSFDPNIFEDDNNDGGGKGEIEEYIIDEMESNLNKKIISSNLDRVEKYTSSFIMNTIGILQSSPSSVLRNRTGFVCNYRALLTPNKWHSCLGAIKSVFGMSEQGKGLAILLSGTYTKDDGSVDTKQTILHAYESVDASKFTIFTLISVASSLIEKSRNYKMYGQVSRYKKGLMGVIGLSEISPTESIQNVIFTTGLRSRKIYTMNGSKCKSDIIEEISKELNLPPTFIDTTIRNNINNESINHNIIDHILYYTISEIEKTIVKERITTKQARIIFNTICDSYGYKNKSTKTINFEFIKTTLLESNGYEIKTINGIKYFKKASTSLKVKKTTQPIKEEIIEAPAAPVSEINTNVSVEVNNNRIKYNYDFRKPSKLVNKFNKEDGNEPKNVVNYANNITTNKFEELESIIKNIRVKQYA